MPYFHYATWKGSQALSLWHRTKKKEATLVIYGTVRDLLRIKSTFRAHIGPSVWGGGFLFDNVDTIVSTLLSLCVPFDFGDHYAHGKQTEGANTSLISERQRLGAQKSVFLEQGRGGGWDVVNARLWRPAPPPPVWRANVCLRGNFNVSFKWTYKHTLKTLGGVLKKNKKLSPHTSAESIFFCQTRDLKNRSSWICVFVKRVWQVFEAFAVMILTKLVSFLPEVTQLQLNDSGFKH